MRLLSSKTNIKHLLLCVFLGHLWGVADSTTTSPSPASTVAKSSPTTTTTLPPTTATARPSTPNVENVTQGAQNKANSTESSLVTATPNVENMTQEARNKAKSTEPSRLAVTAPPNVENVTQVAQTETSITLKWTKVKNSTYILRYNDTEEKIKLQDTQEVYVVSGLTPGTKYSFTLITVFEGYNSTGIRFYGVTAPPNVKNLTQVAQTETSITLKWTKVNNSTYILRYNDTVKEIILPETQEVYLVSGLTPGTKYSFTLITVFEGYNSTGIRLYGVTAPKNVENVTQVAQNETSITLKWKKINNSTYILRYNDTEEKIKLQETQDKYVVSGLTPGTKYNFTLITVFEDYNSTGITFNGVTAPRNTEEFKPVGQNETSINLQWTQVSRNYSYIVAYNYTNFPVPAALQTYTVVNLTSGTRYEFTHFTLFENVKSSGVTIFAVTVPKNVQTVTALTQTESNITVRWDKVNNISHYKLQMDGNNTCNISDTTNNTSVTYTIKELPAGKNHSFKLITVFYYASSTGYTFTFPTAPPKVPTVNVTKRFVTSVTLEWENVDINWEYLLQSDDSDVKINRSSSKIVSYPVTNLSAGTKYFFRVITMFSGLNSTSHEFNTITAIDCASADWQVSSTSIKATIEGLFSNATANNGSQNHVSSGSRNVLFNELYPGATYEIHLVYEMNSMLYTQCLHNVTIKPQKLSARCKSTNSGFSIYIEWDPLDGVWTSVEVDVTGKTPTSVLSNTTQSQTVKTVSDCRPGATYNVTLTSLSGSVRSDALNFDCKTSAAVIVGPVCAAVLFCILVCLAVFIFLKRPDIFSRKKSFISGSKQPNTESKPISAAKFPDHFNLLSLDENRGFSQEYEDLSTVGTEQTRKVAILPENKVKNRFTNVLPYDWCRVKLTSSDETSDYINANYMPGYNTNREYIATQGPLPSTVNDFWRMIWEQRSKRIVMVTNCIEGGRAKCEQYWPADSQPCLYGELLVTKRSEQQKPNWTLREFSVKNKNTSEERAVKHFHFTAWPDHGVPQCTEVLIEFRGLVRQHIEEEGSKSPTVVHCSAGVGRTGTIIALDVLLQQLQKQQAVGIKAFVHKMRLNRPYMVQTESQYVFLHHCIMDSLQPKEMPEESLYENCDMIYANATALREFNKNKINI